MLYYVYIIEIHDFMYVRNIVNVLRRCNNCMYVCKLVCGDDFN